MGKTKGKFGFHLPWPWNIVAGIVVAIALSFVIGPLFSVLLVIGMFHYFRRKNPNMPEGGYCLDRTRSQLKWLPLGLIFAALGGGFLWAYWYGRTHEMNMKQETVIAFLVLGPLFLLLGLVLCFSSIKNSFFPEKSALARSIRSQLPYPEEAPPVSELFAMVDADLQANGQTFDRVIIGREWVLGDEANYLPRLRAAFGRDEIVMRHHGGKTSSTRVVELYLVDDRNQLNITTIKNPHELPMIMDCLRLRVPEAYFGSYDEMSSYRKVPEEVQAQREAAFRRQQRQRENAASAAAPGGQENVVLSAYGVNPTSQVDEAALGRILAGDHRDRGLALVAGRPLPLQGVAWGTMWCCPDQDPRGIQLILEEYVPGADQSTNRRGMCHYVQSDQEAIDILMAWSRRELAQPALWEMGQLEQWQSIDLQEGVRDTSGGSGRPTPPATLSLVAASGMERRHDNFNRADVQAAADGLVSTDYQSVVLTLKGGCAYMHITAGDRTDGRCEVRVSRPVDGALRVYVTKCPHRQAAQWLVQFYSNTFHPDWRAWKDRTRQFEKNK